MGVGQYLMAIAEMLVVQYGMDLDSEDLQTQPESELRQLVEDQFGQVVRDRVRQMQPDQIIRIAVSIDPRMIICEAGHGLCFNDFERGIDFVRAFVYEGVISQIPRQIRLRRGLGEEVYSAYSKSLVQKAK